MKKTVLFLFALFCATGLCAKQTVIYHTSDTHGFFFPKNGQGGAVALAEVLQSGPQKYLLLDGGDFAEGTVETKNSKGLKAVQLMNELKYDAAAVGNHEFAFKDAGFDAMLKQARFPFLAANLTLAENGEYPQGILPYKIFDVDGVKIAVIGLANRNPSIPSQIYRFSKPLPALQKALQEIEPLNPAAVVVLVHDSLNDDRPGSPNYVGDIGRQFGGKVNVVLGGHAHKIFQNVYRGDMLFVEGGCNFQNVSKVTIETDDKTGQFVSARSELIALVPEEQDKQSKIAQFVESLREPGVDDVVGQTAVSFEKRSTDNKHMDSEVDDWVADVTCRYAPADVCIHNTGGARVGLPKGVVTRRDLIDLYPFDNTIIHVTVSGEFLKKLVAGGLVPWNRLAYSGLTLTYKKTKSGKVKDLKIWVRGKRLEEDKEYTLSVNSYVAGGGSEGKLFNTLPKDSLKQAGRKTVRHLLEEDFKRGKLTPPVTGRIVQQ